MGLLGRSWGGLEAILGPPGPLLAPLGAALGPSWAALGASWELLGPSWRLQGCFWGLLGRSKIDPKIDPKLDSKTGRIATEKNRSRPTPVVVSAISRTHRESDEGALENYLNRFQYD